jgi:ribosomal protein S12 methylthiotransferase
MKSIKEERRVEINVCSKKNIKAFVEKSGKDKNVTVQIEGRESEELFYGRSYGEAPEVDGLVYVHSTSPLNTGDFIRVKITKVFDYDLLGEVYESGK